MRHRTATFTVAFALALGAASNAHAQSDDDRATARQLGVEGQQALDSHAWATAEDRFRRADKLLHAPTLMLGLARALAAEAKYVEAQEAYNRMIREGLPPGAPDVFKRALEDAKKEVEVVTPKLGSVVITVKATNGSDVADPKVVVDERPVNAASLGIKRAVDPGQHTIRVTADGYKNFEARFSVLEGGAANEAVTLEAAPNAPTPAAVTPAPAGTPAATPAATPGPASTTAPGGTEEPPKKSILPWVAFGVGGAGLLTGIITGVVAMGDHSSLAKDCTNGTCPASDNDKVSSYHTMGLISTIGFIVAGVGAGAGVVLLVTQPKGAPAESSPSAPPPAPAAGLHLYPVIGLDNAGVVGSF